MHAAYTDFSRATLANFSRPPLPAIHHSQETVYLLDPDYRVRKELTELLAEFEIKVIGLTSVLDYLHLVRRDSAACLVLDMHLPDIRSLVRQPKLSEGLQPPVIFISGECDVRSTVWAMKAGRWRSSAG